MTCVEDLGCDGGSVHSCVQVDRVLCVNVRIYVIVGSNVDQLEFLSIDMYDRYMNPFYDFVWDAKNCEVHAL